MAESDPGEIDSLTSSARPLGCVATLRNLSASFASLGSNLGLRTSKICLDISGFVNHPSRVPSIKISSKVDEDTWNELKALAAETHQNVSGVLTEAIRDYIKRKRVRPEVLNHLERSIADNEELGRLLAK
jgi:predicted transcriptional regulator